MPNARKHALNQALKWRLEGTLKADANTLVVVYQELAMGIFLVTGLLSPSNLAMWLNLAAILPMLLARLYSTHWPLRLRTWAPLFLIGTVITGNSWLYGGLNSLFMIWYLVIPVPLLLILGVPSMLWSLGLVAAFTGLTYGLQSHGWVNAIPAPGTNLMTPMGALIMMMLTVLSIPLVSYVVLRQIVNQLRLRNIELKESQHVLLEQRRQQDEFVACVSHELRTPMNGIIGFLQSMDTQSPTLVRHRHMFDAMGHSAQHLLTVINDLLDFSQIQIGNLRISPRAMSLRQLLRDVATMFEAPLRERGIPLELHISERAPDWIEGDEDRITQVIINLLGNAAKFTRSGHIALRADVTDKQALRIEIEDTGCGIDAAQIASVFDRFSPLTDKTRREYGGTGLGLSISQNLVHLMGGNMGVHSIVNVGSTFWFELPLTLARPTANAHPDTRTPAQQGVQGCTLLIVDDSAINRAVARHMVLSGMPDAQIVDAESGHQALALIQQQAFDLVLMDVIMPELDGIETTRMIHAQAGRTPAIMGLTADVSPNVHQACLDAGMVTVLTKPYKRAELLEAMRAALQRHDTVGPAVHTPHHV